MKNLGCEVIQDLLPLYIDGICSDESKNLVEEHLECCQSCKKMYEMMLVDIKNVDNKKEEERVSPDNPFHFMWKRVVQMIVTLAVMISCCVINLEGAFYGGPAKIGSFLATISCIVVIGIFTVVAKDFKPCVKIMMILSRIICISSGLAVICRITHYGGFILGFLAGLSALPFYGFRMFTDWTVTYVIGLIVSIVWVIFTTKNWKYLNHHEKE